MAPRLGRSRAYGLARALLDAGGMHRIALSSMLVGALSLPALADPAPLHFQLGVKQGADARSYQLLVGEDSCGGITSKVADREDKIRVCAQGTQQGVRIRVDWTLSSKAGEYRTDFESVVQRGATIELGQAGGVRLTLQMT
jgi:hypothetical protein